MSAANGSGPGRVGVPPAGLGVSPKRSSKRAEKAATQDASLGLAHPPSPAIPNRRLGGRDAHPTRETKAPTTTAPARSQQREKIERLEAKNRELTRTLRIIEDARAVLADQYDFAPIGFVTLDAKGCVREINLTAARMLGRERSSLIAMPFFTFVAKPHVPAFLHHLRECRGHPREVISDVTLRMRRGGVVPVELRSVPVLDPRRGDTVFRTTISDIAERLRAGKALRESEERYRDLVELSPDGIFITIAEAIVFANSAARRLCEVESVDALIDHKLTDWICPSYQRSLNAMLREAADTRQTSMIEAKLTRRDGTLGDVELVASAFRHEGEAALRVVMRDISRRRQAERHVLRISERERSDFGRDLHDGLCQNLAGAACLAEALRKDLRKINAASAQDADQISQAIRQCMEEARSLAHGLCPVTMESTGLVAALHELTASVSRRTRVGCALECDDSLAIRDVSVATHVYRIAQEAVGNAIRHGHAKSVLIQLAANNGRMSLRVEDDGTGISAKPNQTGMGLHTMRYRANIIGGSLDVLRKKPRGTVVTCTFPSHAEPS